MGLVDDVKYEWYDFWNESNAEKQCKIYSDVIRKVEKQMAAFEDLDTYDQTLELELERFESNPGCAEGKWMTTFMDKEAIIRSEKEAIISAIRSGIQQVSDQLEVARNELAYWQSEAEREDREHIYGS